jgi:hypothetical protein
MAMYPFDDYTIATTEAGFEGSKARLIGEEMRKQFFDKLEKALGESWGTKG